MLLSTGAGRLVQFRDCFVALKVSNPHASITHAPGVQVLLHDRTAVGMGTTAHDVAAPDTSLPLLCKQAFMVEAAYQVAPGALSLPQMEVAMLRASANAPSRPMRDTYINVSSCRRHSALRSVGR